MAGQFSRHASHSHVPKPLVVRGGLGRTFGSLASFLALTLIAGGSYILADAFSHPVNAQAAGLIAAAFVIALGLLLLFYLLKPRRTGRAAKRRTHSHLSVNAMTAVARPAAQAAARHDSRGDLAYQRVYVDHSRIRP
ncbi:MAG TPA: hypothetical protein VMH48_07735 [Methylomirabilota bacterium]|nr:hypothetical protein [Methylomirabilota bacterium]